MRRWIPVLFVAAVAAGSLFIVWSANRLLMPDVAHTEEILQRAHAMQRFAPFATILLAAAGALVTVRSWKGRRERIYRVVSVLPLLALVVIAVVARRPVVERMFSPIDDARFVPVAEATFLADDALVLGVAVGGVSKTYPISMMAYHHLLNDELAGEAFVVTY